jgi:protein-S-isoprenylcysteine O-methyltransferase Ste14
VIWASLTLHWIAPWLLVSRGVQAPPWYLGTCVFIFTLGIFWHFVSDMQKHIFLKLSPGHLLTDGLWSRLRNPNYFGELLIYLGFGMLAMHWVPLLVIVLFVLIVWLPNMRRKDRSLARYPDFADYRARSRLFLPFVW